MARTTSVLRVDGHDVPVSSLEKVLYPDARFTKGDVINYYIAVAPVLLPHLEDRALTMKRYPDGVGKFFFYEKNCPPYRPKWVRTTRVPSSVKGKDDTHYCVVDTLPGLVWAANLADLELHVSLARASARARPTTMVFDLDPGPGTDVIDCARVAVEIRARFARDKIQCWVKTSGSKGLQLYVPLNTPKINFDRTKEVARQLAESLAADFPKSIVANMRKELRKGKVFIDWSQNDDHKTTVCVYSLRATPTPFVSTPLQWKEVETAAKNAKAAALRFTPDDVLKRVKKHGDLFEPVLKLRQRL